MLSFLEIYLIHQYIYSFQSTKNGFSGKTLKNDSTFATLEPEIARVSPNRSHFGTLFAETKFASSERQDSTRYFLPGCGVPLKNSLQMSLKQILFKCTAGVSILKIACIHECMCEHFK